MFGFKKRENGLPMSSKVESVNRASTMDTVIDIKGLNKCYQIYSQPQHRLKQAFSSFFSSLLGRPLERYYQDFWALKEIEFSIQKGQTVGIVGLNGSGKSTLLQLICGTLTPTSGTVEVQGRVAALLELGSGFNPEFSGRENVMMYASILGLSQTEIDDCFDQIVDFADIGEFINHSVKTYSSGMVVRLAFAVIAHVNADILVIDEALAVGDAIFTQKCMRFLRDFQKRGTLLFVSHDISAVQNLCDSAIWLDHGGVQEIGTSKAVAQSYLQHSLQALYGDEEELESIEMHDNNKTDQVSTVPTYESQLSFTDNLGCAEGWQTGIAEITRVRLTQHTGEPSVVFQGGEKVRLIIEATAHQALEKPVLGFVFKDRLGQDLFGENTLIIGSESQQSAKEGERINAEFIFTLPMLPNGDYVVMASVANGDLDDHTQHHLLHDACVIKVFSSNVRWGLVGLKFDQVSLRVNDSKFNYENIKE